MVYLLITLGAVGTFLLLPRSGKRMAGAGAVFGTLGLLGLFLLLLIEIADIEETGIYFAVFATIAIASAARVVTHSKPVYSALYFVGVVLAVSAMLVLLHAEFLAIALIIIYAGAILVTYVFVIMLAQKGPSAIYDQSSREPALAVLAGFLLAAAVAGHAGNLPDRPRAEEMTALAFVNQASAQLDSAGNQAEPQMGNTEAIGWSVMTKYVVALELAGLLLLIAMVGAIALSRKQVPSEVAQEPRRPVGEVGRTAEPF